MIPPSDRQAIAGDWVRFSWDLASASCDQVVVPPGFDVRNVSQSDRDAVLQVVIEAYASEPVWAGVIDAISNRMRTRIAETIDRDGVEYVGIFRGNELVAVSGVAREHWTDQHLLTGICVIPRTQRCGIGTFLLGYSLQRLRALGVKVARVYTEAGSLADVKIYPLFGSRREPGVSYPGATQLLRR